MAKDRSRHIAAITALTLLLGLPSLAANPHAIESSAKPITVAIKYVALRSDTNATVAPTRREIEQLVTEMSHLWSPCHLRFVLEEYITPYAAELDVAFNPGNSAERYRLRERFTDRKRAVYIVTGRWDRARDSNDNGSNAFSSVPGDGPQAIVLENGVARSHRLLSHEFGHLGGNLDDTNGADDLMNHLVSATNTKISQEECVQVVGNLRRFNAEWIR